MVKPASSMNDMKETKTNFCVRHRWPILILSLILIVAIIGTIIAVVLTRHQSDSIVNSIANISMINDKYNITIKGLLTMDTVAQANVCEKNQTMEDCVLVHNSKIIMGALVMASSSNSSVSYTYTAKSKNSTTDCRGLRIRRGQLSQIFDPQTLQTIYNVSGVPYINQAETRSQIDARSIRSRWTSPINYYIDRDTGLTSNMITSIYTAISNWQNNTCLQFNELPAITSTTNRTYIRFERDDQYGCSSPVGFDRTDPTSIIYLAASCGTVIATVMHEIGHSLGYIHTHSRIDRDNYVTIATENIEQDYIVNLIMWVYGTIRFLDVNIPYDFGSFMHYEPYGFSNNGRQTIVPHDAVYEKTMGQRQAASFYDYKQINRLYCTRTDCPQMFRNNNCQNSGYLDPRTCSRCICPSGFSGPNCDQRDSASNCGDIITNPTPNSPTQITIQNPLPTSTTSTQQYCVFLIQSQSAGKIRFRLDSINTAQRQVCSISSSVEVKYQSDFAVTGARWCGNTITTAWSNVTAQGNAMVVIFRANNYINRTTASPQTGFRATIFFDAEPAPVTPPTILNSTTTRVTTTTTTTITTRPVTNALTATQTASSTCPPSSFRCRLPSQPTCGGCLNFQPCSSEGTQLCTAFAYQIQLTDCNAIVNGRLQCRYQFVQTSFTTTCTRTILLCCPNYQLITYQSQHYCVYNPQALNPAEWSLLL